MSKTKVIYSCQSCGAQSPKWIGLCPDCNQWNTYSEDISLRKTTSPSQRVPITALKDVTLSTQMNIPTHSAELNRVLGGGLVEGAVILIGGDPGIGKSTLVLQTLCHLSENYKTLYVSGEESLQQITLHTRRLNLPEEHLLLLAETNIERIIEAALTIKPHIMVIDSIQTMYTEQLSSAPGGVGQVRGSTAQLVQFAKQTNTTLLLIGHVTKEGAIAGPRVLEHMVDTVLYFENGSDNRFRMLRAIKNRFGAVNELGIFAMTDRGLKEVSNPSAIFLTHDDTPRAGSAITVTWEGTRPLLIEVQALVDESHLGNPRRTAVGLEVNRLSMLLAILNRHGRITSFNQDVFVNVVGGVRISETAVDLACVFAILSSMRDRTLSRELIIFGEVGLAGEIRPVQSGQERLREAVKHGFKQAIIPKANCPKTPLKGIDIRPVQNLSEALEIF